MASNFIRGALRQSDHSPETTISSLLDRIIAELPIRSISAMSRDDLIHVIRESQLPLIDARTLRRLPFFDRSALERLAHLARRCCRSRSAQERGAPQFETADW
jgi:hypothetical protein